MKIGLGWCERGDSNSHGLPHWHLKPARLPVPPLSLIEVPHPGPQSPRRQYRARRPGESASGRLTFIRRIRFRAGHYSNTLTAGLDQTSRPLRVDAWPLRPPGALPSPAQRPRPRRNHHGLTPFDQCSPLCTGWQAVPPRTQENVALRDATHRLARSSFRLGQVNLSQLAIDIRRIRRDHASPVGPTPGRRGGAGTM